MTLPRNETPILLTDPIKISLNKMNKYCKKIKCPKSNFHYHVTVQCYGYNKNEMKTHTYSLIYKKIASPRKHLCVHLRDG